MADRAGWTDVFHRAGFTSEEMMNLSSSVFLECCSKLITLRDAIPLMQASTSSDVDETQDNNEASFETSVHGDGKVEGEANISDKQQTSAEKPAIEESLSGVPSEGNARRYQPDDINFDVSSDDDDDFEEETGLRKGFGNPCTTAVPGSAPKMTTASSYSTSLDSAAKRKRGGRLRNSMPKRTGWKEIRREQDMELEACVKEVDIKREEEEERKRQEDAAAAKIVARRREIEEAAAALPVEPSDGALVAVQMLDRSRIQRKFASSSLAKDIYAFVAAHASMFDKTGNAIEFNLIQGVVKLEGEKILSEQGVMKRTLLTVVEV